MAEGVLGGLAMSLTIHLALIIFALTYPVSKPQVDDEQPVYTVTLLDGGGTPQKKVAMATAKKPVGTVKKAPEAPRASAETEKHTKPVAASAKPEEKTVSDMPVPVQTLGYSAAVSPTSPAGVTGGDERPGSESGDGPPGHGHEKGKGQDGGTVGFGGNENDPAFIVRAVPKYPVRAKRLGKEGTVLLLLTLNEKGRLVNADVVEKAGFGFEEAALSAVRQSVFRPARRDGHAVVCRVYLPIVFLLNK